jgi:hypothetical protein
MAHIEINGATDGKRSPLAHVRRAQMMLVVAGLAAFSIVAVAAAMLTTLL